MARVRAIKTLQKFTSVQASIHTHVNHPRQLTRRDISNTAEPPPWPSGVNVQSDRP